MDQTSHTNCVSNIQKSLYFNDALFADVPEEPTDLRFGGGFGVSGFRVSGWF